MATNTSTVSKFEINRFVGAEHVYVVSECVASLRAAAVRLSERGGTKRERTPAAMKALLSGSLGMAESSANLPIAVFSSWIWQTVVCYDRVGREMFNKPGKPESSTLSKVCGCALPVTSGSTVCGETTGWR